MFIAKFEYGKPRLAEVDVVKETPATFTVTNQRNLLDHMYVGERIFKDRTDYFTSKDGAARYLRDEYRKYRDRILGEIGEADTALTTLEAEIYEDEMREERRA